MIDGQTTIFDMLYPKKKIIKPIRLIELDNMKIIVHSDGNIETCFHNNIRKNGRII